MIKQMLCAMALLGGIAMSASTASAQINVTVPLPTAYTYFGMVGSQPKLVSLNVNTGACASANVGSAIGGLSGNVTVWGTSNQDVFTIISTPTTHCGFNMTTLNTNGRTVTMRAQGQADWIDAGAFAGVTLVGDSGDDIISHYSFNGSLWGTGNNDLIIGSTNGSFFGEDGDDKLCAGSGTNVAQFNGGNGTDYHCGIPAILWSSNLDCSKC